MSFQREHVERAFREIRLNGISPNRASTKWDIIDPKTGVRFPPKAVIRIAKKLANDSSYLGGGGPATNEPLRARGFEILLKPHLERSAQAEDINEILNSKRDQTTKQRLVNARLGQGGFREAVVEAWGGKCALTECTILEVLIASHIKPWREATDTERLDPNNGLLLAASIDALFDKLLITFSADGFLEIAKNKDVEEIERLGIRAGQLIQLTSTNQYYMEWHRKAFYKKV